MADPSSVDERRIELLAYRTGEMRRVLDRHERAAS